MEGKVFHRPEVLRELKNFVEVRLHTDVGTDWSNELLAIKNERHDGNQTTPIYELVDPGTRKTIDRYFGANLPSGAKFVEYLKKHKHRKPSPPPPEGFNGEEDEDD
jgi:hypothetical protein